MSRPSLPIGPDWPWLAPLAGFSDLPFRLLCREQGAAAACTEMVSAKGLALANKSSDRLLASNPQDEPLVVQIYGSEPDVVCRAMDILLARGFVFFDLNAGCPVPKVTRTGSGAALLRTPETLLRMARCMVDFAGAGRVGVKLRLGWSKGRKVLPELALALEDAGAGWLTLHPRWAAQGFSGRADWESIAALRSAVAIPVMASGDLFRAEDACRCLETTNATGVMFARGALWDPSIFRKFLHLRGAGDRLVPAVQGCVALARRHMALAREHLPDRRALLTMRTIVPRYLRSMPGARVLRQRLTMVSSWGELEVILDAIDRPDSSQAIGDPGQGDS